MKQFLTFFVFAAALFGLPVVQADTVTYTAVLEGSGESPPNASPGSGTATIIIDLDLLTMDVTADFSELLGITTASHIHCCTAAPDTGSAGVATSTPTFPGFPLGVSSGTYSHLFDMSFANSYNPSFITAHGSVAGAYAALIAGLDAARPTSTSTPTSHQPGRFVDFSTLFRPCPNLAAWLCSGWDWRGSVSADADNGSEIQLHRFKVRTPVSLAARRKGENHRAFLGQRRYHGAMRIFARNLLPMSLLVASLSAPAQTAMSAPGAPQPRACPAEVPAGARCYTGQDGQGASY